MIAELDRVHIEKPADYCARCHQRDDGAEDRDYIRDVECREDVLTNWLPGARQRAHLDVEDIVPFNPNIVYVRGRWSRREGPRRRQGRV